MKYFVSFEDYVGKSQEETSEQKKERIRKERLKKLSRIIGEEK